MSVGGATAFNFGDLAGLSPVSPHFGYDRGQPLDRFYIERFLARHRSDIRGHVLEVGDDVYTRRFGEDRVIRSSVLDVRAENPRATVIADLADAPQIPDATYDCVVLTQVLELTRDFEAVLRTVARILKPSGVALITVPGISQISTDATEAALWSWSFYPATLRAYLARYFDPRKLLVEPHGNVKTAIGFLAGLAQEDLAPGDFHHEDPRYPLIVAARGVKPGAALSARSAGLVATRPKVSVLMPMFNAAPYVAEAIESVRSQSFREWELIVVDDGSTDGCHDIVRNYADREPERIRLFRHADGRNRGLSQTANRALAEARADMTAFLDADDTWLPAHLAHDVAALDRHPSIAAVISNSLYWWIDGQTPARVDKFCEPLDEVWPPRRFFRSTWLKHEADVPCITAFTVRTDILRTLGGFDESYPVAMDMKLIAEVSFRYPVLVAGVCNTEYRRMSHSLWSRAMQDGRDAAARRRFVRWMRGLIARDAAGDASLMGEFSANLSHPSSAHLLGCRIAGPDWRKGPPPTQTAGAEGTCPGDWSAVLHLEAGSYLLQIPGASVGGTGTFAIQVSDAEDDRNLAEIGQAWPPSEPQAPSITLPFEVAPPARNVRLRIAAHGELALSLGAIEIRANEWPFELPERL